MMTSDCTVVRDYHHLEFHQIPEGEANPDGYALSEIAKIIMAEMKPQLSRGIIFINSRRKCEEYSETLFEIFQNKRRQDLTVGYYHAGMPAEVRSQVEDEFRRGDKAIIFATKAFGMGIDIPNIHFVFHQRPPSNLENYLQEIGRAGRNAESRQKAGISKVRCLLFYNKDNFNKTRQKILTNRWHWSDLEAMRQIIYDYWQQLGDRSQSSFIIPVDLIKESKNLADKRNPETTQKMLLYWLERLGKITLGDRLISHVNLSLGEKAVTGEADLIELVKSKGGSAEKFASILMSELRETLGVETHQEVFEILFKEHSQGTVYWHRNFRLKMTNFGLEEMGQFVKLYDHAYQALAEFTKPLKNRDQITPKQVEAVLNQYSYSAFSDVTSDHQKFAKERLLKSFPKMIRLLNRLDGIEIVGRFNGVQVVYIASNNWRQQLTILKKFTADILSFINAKHEEKETVNLGDLAKVATIDHPKLLKAALSWLQSLGYIRYDQDFMPTSLQIYLEKGFERPIDELELTESERQVKRDFDNYYLGNEWRLNALEALAEIPEEGKRHDFIRNYFACRSVLEIRELILNIFPESSVLGAKLRQTAFKDAIAELNEEQKSIVYTSPNTSLIVAAGPGSGKTKTLLMCVAYLIVEQKESPADILVLAYNTAVVIELKTRLSQLLRELGYASSYNSLQIYTFHGYVRRSFGNQLPEKCKVEDYLTTYLDVTATNKSLLRPDDRPAPHYIFIDEYQDMNRERYEMLLRIKDDRTKAIAIGDDDQSIYGYERKKAEESMSARPYFERFERDFKATWRNLSINYRSGTEILNKAQEYISRNCDRLRSAPLRPGRKNVPGRFVEEQISTDSNRQILNAIKNILNHPDRPLSVAILFRTNAELYRVLEQIRHHADDNIKIRVQGGREQFANLREVAVVLDELRKESDRPINSFPKGFLQKVRKLAWELSQSYPAWSDSSYYLLAAVAWSFEKINSSDTSVAQFIEQIEAVRDLAELTLIYKQYQSEERQDNQPYILVSTIHKIKGLEFDSVLIPAADSSRNITDPQTLEEERRLRYVAMTRARDYLHLIEGDREVALFKGKNIFKQSHSQFGLAFDSGDGYAENNPEGGKGMITLFCFASDRYARYNPPPGKQHWTGEDLQSLIFEKVTEGDRLELVWDYQNEYYHIFHSELRVNIGRITRNNSVHIRKKFPRKDRLQGLFVTDVSRHQIASPSEEDAKYNKHLCSSVIQQGYYYIVNVNGYLK